jgi:hypothetical protein
MTLGLHLDVLVVAILLDTSYLFVSVDLCPHLL